MVIFEGSITHRVFSHKFDADDHHKHNNIILGLAKVCIGAIFTYLILKILIFIHEQHWYLLNGSMGGWFLIEIVGFVLLPLVLYIIGYRNRNIITIRIASIFTLIGIVLNRLNITVIGFQWDAPIRYIPTWMEIVVTFAIIFIEIWIFRWIITRLPVLNESRAIPTKKEIL